MRILSLLALALLLATPVGFASSGAWAQAQPQVCPGGVIVYQGQPCPVIPKWCADGTAIPANPNVSPQTFCNDKGGTVWGNPNAPAPAAPSTPATPAPSAPASTTKCVDGSTVPAETVAKGRGAMVTYCSSRGGLKGAVGGTR